MKLFFDQKMSQQYQYLKMQSVKKLLKRKLLYIFPMVITHNLFILVDNKKKYFFLDFNKETIGLTLSQILPMIAHYKTLTDKYNLIEPLKELVIDGSSEDVLTPDYRQIISNADSIREQFKQTPVHLNRLCSMFNKIFLFIVILY